MNSHRARMLVLVSIVAIGGAASAQTRPSVAVVMQDEGPTYSAVVNGFIDARFKVVDKGEIDRVRRGVDAMDADLFNDETRAGAVGKALAEDSLAQVMVVVRIDSTAKQTPTGDTIVESDITIKVRRTVDGEILAIESGKAKDSATDVDRAREGAEIAAVKAILPGLAEKVMKRLAEAAPEARTITLAIHRFPENEDTKRIAVRVYQYFSALKGLSDFKRSQDKANQRYELTFVTTRPAAELDAGFMASVMDDPDFRLFACGSCTEDRLEYFFQRERDPDATVLLEGLPVDLVRKDGEAFMRLVRGIPGVEQIDRLYDGMARRLTIHVWKKGKVSDLEGALQDSLAKSPLRDAAKFVGSEPAGIRFAYQMSGGVYAVELGNASEERYREQGWQVQAALHEMDGVMDPTMTYRQESYTVRIEFRSTLPLFEVERRVWATVSKTPGFEDLAMGRSDGSTIRYLFRGREGQPGKVVLRLTGASPEQARAFNELITSLPGVSEVEKGVEREGAGTEFRMKYAGTPFQLDVEVQRGAAAVEALATLAPGDFEENRLSYYFLSALGERMRAYVRLRNLAPDRFDPAGLLFEQTVKAIEGVSDVKRAYDAGQRTMQLELLLKGDIYRLDQAIWDALGKDDGAVKKRVCGDLALAPGLIAGNAVEYLLIPPGEEGRAGGRLPGQPIPPLPPTGPAPVTPGGDGVEQTVKAVEKSVVYISVHTASGNYLGTGFFVSDKGHLLTNRHVVVPNDCVTGITVRTLDGKEYPAEVIQADAELDLALVKAAIPTPEAGGPFPPVAIGDSDTLQQGQLLVVIGHPRGLAFSVTTGRVSRLDGDRGHVQIDASLHPGNSGGPISNVKGEVVGVSVSTMAVVVSDSGGETTTIVQPGLSYMIPINFARNLLQLIGR